MTDRLHLAGAPIAGSVPLPTRWQPTRAGLVNAWRYLDEVLEFHRGRLLLRGPNGSGKSMALELLLPFLLDANAGQHRLTSAAKARGGLFDRLIGEDTGTQAKVAYLWVEFARADDRSDRDDHDGERTCTIGVRLRASASTRQVDKLWFVTPQRVSHELALLDEARVPLARAALTERLEAGGGRAFDDALAYRTRVREVLYPGFGEDQYDAVITALLALRQEKLSQNLDLDRLSATLSSALPALDEREVADAAEGFRQLDQRRDNLEQLAADLEVVGRLRTRQRGYARARLRGAAAEVTAAETARDRVTRRERETAGELADAQAQDTVLADEDGRRRDRVAELRGEVEALRQRDAYREGRGMEALRAETDRSRRTADRERDRRDVAATREHEAADAAAETHAAAVAAAGHVEAAHGGLAGTAERTGAGTALAAATAAEPDAAAAVLTAWIDRRRDQLAAVREALTALEAAVRTRDDLAERREEAAATRETLLAAERDADTAVDDAIAELRDALAGWLDALATLEAQELTGLPGLPAAELDELETRIRTVADRQRERLVAEDARLAATLDELDRDRADVAEHRRRLADASEPELDAPPWRRDRHDLPGAPLWRLLDVQDHVDADTAARLEAGLAAAGLLDAWVQPDGQVAVPAGEADVVVAADLHDLDVADADLADSAGSLAEVLRAEVQDHVPTAVVTRLLTRIGLVDRVPGDVASDAGSARATVIGRDGTFRIGTLTGRGPVGEAGYLGATAREQRRRRQLAELDRQLAALDARRDELEDARGRLAARRADLDAEVARRPTTAALDAAAERARLATARREDAEVALDQLSARHGEAEEAVRGRQRHLTAAAAEHGLPTSPTRLDEVDGDLHRLDRQASAWIGRRRQHEGAQLAAERQAAVAADASAHAEQAGRQAAAAGRDHRELAARLDALEQTVGSAYRDVVARIETCQAEQGDLEERGPTLAEERLTLRDRLGRLAAALETAERDRDRAEADRDQVQARLAGLLRDGFATDADVTLEAGVHAPGTSEPGTDEPGTEDLGMDERDGRDVPTGVTAVLGVARDFARQLDGVDGDAAAIDRARSRVEEGRHLAGEQLRGRADLTSTRTEGGWWLLRASVEGTTRTVTGLRDTLDADLAAARAELADHERELYDRTLTEGLRRHLVGRIRRATELTGRINTQLRKVRTEAGVAVQLAWELDPAGGEAVAHARPLLLKEPADLDDAERDALHGFLRARIDLVRDPDASDDTSWEGRLLRAFDYRAWHRFGLKVSHQAWGGEFRPATAKRLQQLSTGERSVVLHLPMLASIAAHYDAVDADQVGCPRLILLDELFVGVDPVNRAQLFGMFVEWDLDAVLTSDHEWCRYASLDGIAIHQVHGDGDPVVTTRFVWDGRADRMVAAADGAS